MYKFIQKNQKKFLAIFGALLMVVFILPTGFKNGTGGGDVTIGTIDGKKITLSERAQAKNDLELLHHYEFLPYFELGGAPESRDDVTVADRYFQGEDGALTYLLLQKEAEKEGFSISPQAADALASAGFRNMPQNLLEQMVPVVGRFMLVQAAFERASEGVKATQPLVEYYLSQSLQRTKLNLVEYSAAELEKSIAAPTPQQVRDQYYKYGAALARPSTPGYKVPDRVKLQYLEVPRQAVVDSVLNELSRDELYDLDLEGFRYYQSHQSEFPVPPPPAAPSSKPSTAPTTAPTTATQPAAAAATQPSTAPATVAAATQPSTAPATVAATPPATAPAAPTTMPFADVKLELRRRLLTEPSLSSADLIVALRARVAARDKQLRAALHDELDRDYAEWEAAHSGKPAKTQPAHPTTNPLVAIYPDLDFLTAFANRFEAQYKVRPLVTSLANKWLVQEDLDSIPDLGTATQGETPFAEYAMHDLAPAPTAPAEPLGPPVPSNLLTSRPAATNPTTAPATSGPATAGPTTAASATTAPTTTGVASSEPTTSPSELSPEALTSWRPIGTGLRPFEPSNLLEDSAGNTYIFRLTAFEPAHRPPLADVEHQILAELKSATAYQLAKDDAAKLLENARIESKLRKEQRLPDLQGLPAAAKASGKKLIEAGPFQSRTLMRAQSIRGYDPSDIGDKYRFLLAVDDLAKQQTPDNLHPSALIELPAEHKVLVAELGDTRLPVPGDEMYAFEQAVAPMARRALENGQFMGRQSGANLIEDWFGQNNVIARLKYIKAKGS